MRRLVYFALGLVVGCNEATSIDTSNLPSSAPGPSVIRVRDAGASGGIRLGGLSFMMSNVGQAPYATIVRAGSVASGAARTEVDLNADTVLSIAFEKAPVVGALDLPAVPVRSTPTFAPGPVYLRVRTGPNAYKFYVPVTATHLEVEAVKLPAEPGLAVGNLYGNVEFEAAGFNVQFQSGSTSVSPIGNTTVRIIADFGIPIHWVVYGSGTMEVAGSKHPLAQERPALDGFYVDPAQSSVQGFAGSMVTMQVVTENATAQSTATYTARLWLPGSVPGTAELDGVGGATTVGGGKWAWMWLQHATTSSSAAPAIDETLCVKGVLNIEEFRKPTNHSYGLVRATASCRLLWPARTPDFGFGDLRATFTVPLQPLLKLPV